MESFLGIGELARASGLPVSALRFYDGAGVLVPAAVDPRTGYRRYSPAQVGAARLVARLRRIGMPLDSVRALLAGCDPGPVLDGHLARLEGGLADARRELSVVRALLDGASEAPMTFTMSATGLGPALDAVRYAVGVDPAYPALHGVLLERAGGPLHAVATDRYRLAVATAQASGDDGRVLLPVALVDAARDLLSGSPAGELAAVTVTGDAVRIAVGDREVRGEAAPAADFPDWRRFAPAPGRHEVALDGPAFRAALAAGPAVTKLRESDGAAYEMVVLTLGTDGELTVGGTGDALRVGVNRDFLLDAVGDRDQLVLQLTDPINPLAVRVPGGADWSLLMPVDLTR